MAFLSQDFIDFFKELAPNNNKDWFDLNRKRYEQSVKKPFVNLVQGLIDHFASTNVAFKDLTPSECIFRINRDIRFAKDKSPYKLMCSAVIAPNGKKSSSIHGVYFECGPEAFSVYGGVYEIEKDDLLAVREGIAANLDEFNALISADEFTKVFGEIKGEKNKIIPKELKEAAEIQPLIFNKQFYFSTQFDPNLMLSDELIPTIDACFRAGEPLEVFFNRFIQRK